jgi:ketosteroid isomerase-like protein
MSRIALLIVCFVLVVGPAAAQNKATIQKAGDRWSEAFNKGDATPLAAMYTEDAYVLPPGAEMMKGRSAIAAFWGQQMQQIGDIKCTTLDVKPLVVAQRGRLAPAASKQSPSRLRTAP